MNINKYLEGYESLKTEQLKKELLKKLILKLDIHSEVCPDLRSDNSSALELILCLGNALYESKKNQSSITLYQLAKEEAARANDTAAMGECLLMLGNICQSQHKYGNSISFLTKALEIYLVLNNKSREAVCLAKLGLAEFNLGNYTKAISFYLNAIKIIQDISNNAWVGYLSNSIGVVFERLNDNENAKIYYNKALTIFKGKGLKAKMASPLNNLANMAIKEGNLKDAMNLHLRSLELEMEQDNHEGIFVSLNNIAIIHKKQKNYIQAIKYARKALALKEEHKFTEPSYLSYKILSEIAIENQQLADAEEYIILAETNINRSKYLELEVEITESKVKIAELKGDFQLALKWQKKLTELQKDLYNKKREIQVNENHDKYLLEIKEKEAESFRIKNKELDEANLRLEKLIKDKSVALNLLKESEEKYRNVVERANEMIVILQDNKVVFVNQVALDITGYAPDDLVGKGFMDLVPEEEKETLRKRYEMRMKGVKQLPMFKTVILRKNGEKSFIEASGGIINYEGRRADLVVIRDITERVEADELINQSKKKYKELYNMLRLMADSITDYIWAKDMEGNYTFVNKIMADKLLFAADTKEPLGKKIDYYVKKIRDENSSKYWFTYGELTRDTDQQVIETSQPVEYDEKGYIKLRYHHFEIHKSPFFNEKGDLIGVVGTARDITKQKQDDAAFKENKERLELALLGSGAGLWDIYPQKGTMMINDRWAEMLDFKRSEICSELSCWRELVHPEDIEETDQLLEDHFAGKTRIYEAVYRMKKKYGGWCWILSIGKVIDRDSKGNALRAAGTHIDISERKVQEQKLRTYQDHLKLINKMMRHDLANNFAVIHSGYRLYERTGETKYLKDIDAKALNGVELIGSLKQVEDQFNDPDQLWLVDLLKRVRHIARSFSTLTFKFSGNAIVMGDEVIDSIIKNIFENSINHGNATHIDVRTIKQNDKIELLITDNGKGVAEADLEHIFEEAFTSGDSGNTGLGLYLVKRNMTRYNGSVRASLPAESGLRVTLSFPAVKVQTRF